MASERNMRAFGVLTALTVAGFIALVLVARAAFGADGSPQSQVPALWNKFCVSVEHENDLLHQLDKSLHTLRPERVADADRLVLYTEAIIEHERQTALLKAMRKAEFGKAGDSTDAAASDDDKLY
jgi:hypothetical protein